MEVLSVFFVVLAALLGSSMAQPGLNPVVLGSNRGSSDLQSALELALASIKQSADQSTEASDVARIKIQAVVDSLTETRDSARLAVDQVAVTATDSSSATSVLTNITNIINTCIATSNAEIGNITIRTGLEIVACFTDKLTEAEAILSDVIRLAARAAAIGPNAIAGIQRCPPPSLLLYFQRLACLAGEATKASDESLRIAFELSRDVAKANLLVATLQTDIQMCVGMKIVSHVVETGLVAVNVGLCIIRGV